MRAAVDHAAFSQLVAPGKKLQPFRPAVPNLRVVTQRGSFHPGAQRGWKGYRSHKEQNLPPKSVQMVVSPQPAKSRGTRKDLG